MKPFCPFISLYENEATQVATIIILLPSHSRGKKMNIYTRYNRQKLYMYKQAKTNTSSEILCMYFKGPNGE